MRKTLAATLTAATLIGCGGGVDGGGELMASAKQRRSAIESSDLVQPDAMSKFKADVANAVPAERLVGSEFYRESEKVGTGLNTLMVLALANRNDSEDEQRLRAEQVAQQVPGTRAVALRRTAETGVTLSAYGVVRDVAAHCGNARPFEFIGCTMPDTVDPAMPGYDAALRRFVLSVDAAMKVMPPRQYPIRIYRESHAFSAGHHYSLVVRAEHGELPKEEQKQWAQLLATHADGHHEDNGLGGVRSPEAPSDNSKRVEATVSGVK